MAGPELALIGAGIGAALNPRDPLKGAIIGGIGGYAGGAAMGTASTGSAAAASTGSAAAAGAVPAGTQLYASTVPGLTASGPGSMAAQLAAQTGEFGLAGLTSTGASATYAGAGGNLASNFWNSANQMAMGAKTSEGLNALRMAQQMGGQQPQPTAVSPQQMKRGQVNSAEPIMGLLGNAGPMSIERRKRMSLLG